jgi:uncharacterized protein (DUF433 family)
MDTQGQIEVNPKILMGKPVIKGTRISVESILEKLAEILQAHPHLNKENIKAALGFATQWNFLYLNLS